MFYEPKNGHGLPHNPFNAVITPRPIAWIATRDTQGRDNLAPYSFFNGVAYDPPQVMFASTAGKPDRDLGKDSLDNINNTGVFCVHLIQEDMTNAMNVSSGSYGREVDEFARAGLEKTDCELISCARIAAAPAALECKLTQITRLPGAANYVCFGEVVGVHLNDECMVDGIFDPTAKGLLARMGYRNYTLVRDQFELKRPDE
ncbi:flavin reductase family protein [Aliiroseovarius crassostreae]|uniref:flavin reductase family protein n=1 Tax=Aliiroseovarius crassostreae TaxID=154981 RepID=UPI0022049077|nr:flavin reductase family protein [Aliiroseovarius crassostreae]UWP97627.1 flavin reductase family protein [Aliiroseovarius crassostreae]